MGRDKASIRAGEGVLWERQVATLRSTGPAELFISGPSDGPFANSGIEILPDLQNDIGPLGGITTALRHIRTDWLLVLAVDMPAITAEFLRPLLADAVAGGRGIVPFAVRADGSASTEEQKCEPLAAVYPRAVMDLAEAQLRAGRLKLADLVRSAVDAGLVSLRPAPVAFFENWNTPGDVRA